MIILYVGILLIILSLIRKGKISPYVGFAFVFLIMGFQEGVEGDYMRYKDSFLANELERTVEDEPLWSFLNMLFYPLGWYPFIMCISLFQCWVLTKLTKKYVSVEYSWISPILFFFWFGMMLIQMKALRQGLAIELCYLPFVFDYDNKKRKWLWCFAPIIAAYFIHNSSLIFLPAIVLYYLQVSRGIFRENLTHSRGEFFYPTVVTLIFLFSYISKEAVLKDYLVQLSYLFIDLRFADYMALSEMKGELFNLSSLIVAADAVLVFLITWIYIRVSGTTRLLCGMAIASSFFDVFFFGLGSLARVGYFYLPAIMIGVPIVAENLRNKYNTLVELIFLVFSIGYALKTSLPWLLETADDRFGTFRFIFM